MSRLATKRTEKKTSRRKREREFFETDNQACTGRVTFCYSLTSWTFGHSRFSGLSLSEFINTIYPSNRIVRTSRSSTCRLTETGLIVCQYSARLGSTIGYHSNSWASCRA